MGSATAPLDIASIEKALQDIKRLETTLSMALPAFKGQSTQTKPNEEISEMTVREERLLAALEERNAERDLISALRRASALGGNLHRRAPTSDDASPPSPPLSVSDLAMQARIAGEKAIAAASLLSGRMAALRVNEPATLEDGSVSSPSHAFSSLSTPITRLGGPAPLRLPATSKEGDQVSAKGATSRPLPLATGKPIRTLTVPVSANKWSLLGAPEPTFSPLPSALPSFASMAMPSPPPSRASMLPSAPLRSQDRPGQRSTDPPTGQATIARFALYGYAVIFLVALLLAVGCMLARIPQICGIWPRRKRHREAREADAPAASWHDDSACGEAAAAAARVPTVPEDFSAGVNGVVRSRHGSPGRALGSSCGMGASPVGAGGGLAGGGGEGSQVNRLLRSGKPTLSVSESTLVANFLARQKDLLILASK